MKLAPEYQTEHLFILVGKNPLPNIVAIDALHPENGCVYLVCTAKTRPIADMIIEVSNLDRNKNAKPIQIKDDDGPQIVEEIGRQAAGKSSLGLNYTGGTKHMVLHVFQGIQQAAQACSVKPVLSYLDARTLNMRVERLGSAAHEYTMRGAGGIGLRSLLALHGFPDVTWTEEAILPEIYPHIAQLKPKKFSGWYQKARNGKDKEAQRAILLPSMPSLQPYWNGAATVGELADQVKLDMSDMGEWFAGKWLEHYALTAIRGIDPKWRIDESVLNLKAADFEVDVAALKGYQLFAISCNTQTDKGTIKQKLFEAYTRGRQMGGDEARVAVICFAPQNGDSSPQRIEQEIVREWDVKGQVRVFGAEHLPYLNGHLEHWICEQN